MNNAVGFCIFVALPVLAGIFEIWLPFHLHAKTRRQSFLAVGILNAVFGGFSVWVIVLSAAFDSGASFFPHLLIIAGFLLALLAWFIVGSKPAPR